MKTKLQKEIDNDEELNGKKRILTITSIILLAIQFTGATIVEANTFILKLNFTHQNGLALLLFFSIMFLLIRYYSYARKYHKSLYELWTFDLMSNPKIESYDEHGNDLYGWLHENYPPNFDPMQYRQDEHCSYKTKYKSTWLLVKYFQFDITDEYHSYSSYINIFKKLGLKIYLIILFMEIKYRTLGYFKNRENLDILAPYMLGFAAIISFIFPNEFKQLINCILKYNNA